MLTKGAIGNLVNRYRAVLKKCTLINTFGSLAVASMLVMGGAGVASAANGGSFDPTVDVSQFSGGSISYTDVDWTYSGTDADGFYAKPNASGTKLDLGGEGKSVKINLTNTDPALSWTMAGIYAKRSSSPATVVTVKGSLLDVSVSTITNDCYALMASSATTTLPDAAHRGTLNVTADTVILKATSTNGVAGGIVSMTGGELNVNAKKLTVNADNAIIARGNAILRVNSNADGSVYNPDAVVELNGDVLFDIDLGAGAQSGVTNPDADVTINLTNAESKLTGAITTSYAAPDGSIIIHGHTDEVSHMNLGLSNGATWTATGDSFVNDLALDGGNVNIPAEVDIDADKVSGNGNINMEDAENLGSFTAKNADDAELNVQATDKDGNVKNADGVDAATLKKMRAQVKATDATVTASAAEGDVNGAISIDAKGNVSTAKNTLMDAALKQASITTVALDKILTNDVRKRLGDIRSDKNQTGVWMRWDGGKLKGDGLTNNFNTIQIGGDTKVGTNCRIGVAGSFTHGDTDFARGNGELEGFSFALYSTWMGENGMFADIVTRLGHFSNEMNVEGRKGDMDNRVFSLSGEYGWRFDLCKQFFLEPQVELAYTYVSSDDLQLGTAHYAFDHVNSLVGRAGLVAGWNLPDDMGNVYARASVLQQFMGDAKISGSNGNAYNVQEIDGNDTWMEYGIGANVKLTEKTYIWADVERTAGADLDEEWRGTVGLRYSF